MRGFPQFIRPFAQPGFLNAVDALFLSLHAARYFQTHAAEASLSCNQKTINNH
jgi:hypothetical protein